MENTFSAKYNRFFNFFFYSGWAAIWIASLFRYAKAFLWTGDILLFISLVILIRSNRLNIFSLSKIPTILLGLFLTFLFYFTINTPYPDPLGCLDGFLLNYFFNICLFFLIVYLLNSSILSIFWLIPCIVTALSIIYSIAFVFIKCDLNFACLLKSGIYLVESSLFQFKSLFKGLGKTAPVYLFTFCVFLGLFLKSTGYKKLVFCITSLSSLLTLLWLGRRAALLGCFISFIVLLFLSKKKSLKILSFGILLAILLIIIGVLISPYGKDILIRSDNVQLLFSGEYEKFDEAGSLGQRLHAWPIYLKKVLEHPFSGTGPGMRIQARVLSGMPLGHAHNLFLNLWIQGGLQTALVFLIFYLLSFYKCYHLWKASGEDYFIGGLFLFLIAFFIESLFAPLEEQTCFTPFWIASGLVWRYAQKSS